MSVNCPSCTAPLSERGYYCAACATQVRCKQCQEPLELKARACIMCGTSTGQMGASAAGNSKPTAAINTLELEEDLKSRTVRLHLTDHAVAHVGDALTAVFGDRLASKPRTAQRMVQHVETHVATAGTTGRHGNHTRECRARSNCTGGNGSATPPSGVLVRQ